MAEVLILSDRTVSETMPEYPLLPDVFSQSIFTYFVRQYGQ